MIEAEIRHRAVVHYKYFTRSLRKVSTLYKISKSSLQRWAAQANIKRPRKKRSLEYDVQVTIKQLLDTNPFLTMSQLADRVASICQLKRSPRTLGRYTHGLSYTRKRAYRTIRHKDDHKSLVETFCKEYLAIPTADVISIDEAGFYIGDTCRRGYSKRGKRLNVPTSRTIRMSKLTLIAAVSTNGIVHYKILNHNCKKADFVQFVSELKTKPGTVAVLDNIQFHHSKETLAAFRVAGIRPLYVPPYSPEFNAIENVFSMLKRQYRSSCPINVDEVNAFDYSGALQTLLDARDTRFSADFSGYFRHIASVTTHALAIISHDPNSLDIDKLGYKH